MKDYEQYIKVKNNVSQAEQKIAEITKKKDQTMAPGGQFLTKNGSNFRLKKSRYREPNTT